DLHPVKLDPSQVDQLLTNLCINARDAISGAGTIILETGNITLDAPFCALHPEAAPGEYVFLAVHDDGAGMAPETLAHIFEPFFTTKGIGEGTGLGLATVYGIVKQNDGLIHASSRPGKGTTFLIYLPRAVDGTLETFTEREATSPRGSGETVLLVEDEQSLRNICSVFLDAQGYHVLEAGSPSDAIERSAQYQGDIQLVVTDVVMPGMAATEMVRRIGAMRPGVKVLFMSGYTADVIAQHGVLEKNVFFIAKPFTRDEFACKVRAALEGEGL
ncbi:MAG: ATP-binding protein, partial [Kiritimatiellae bacterium]|nr:ATP-binding protein [Kiritimatiellia bacterium]